MSFRSKFFRRAGRNLHKPLQEKDLEHSATSGAVPGYYKNRCFSGSRTGANPAWMAGIDGACGGWRYTPCRARSRRGEVRFPLRRRCVSILIPVYNERQTIERVLEAAREAPLPPGVDRQLVVVNDGSVDGTGTILSRLEAAGGFELVRLARNSGKGSAIRAGIPRCKGDWILIQDGDLEYDPSCYEALVRPLAEGRARVVYGSRFLGTIERMGWPYRLVNVLLRATTNALYGTRITDEATAYKAFDADLLRRMPLRCRRFEFCPEVTARVARAGIAIHEVPVRYLGRTTEQGKKIRWYDAAIAFWVLFRERLRPAPPRGWHTGESRNRGGL